MTTKAQAVILGVFGAAVVLMWGSFRTSEGAAARLNQPVALLAQDLASGTGGGAHTGATWTTRVVNKEVYDPSHMVTLAGNQFTLKAGTYLIEAQQTIFGDIGIPKGFRGRLRNMTDNVTVAISVSVRLHEETNESATVVSPIPPTLLDLQRTTAFELQYYCESADTNPYALGYGLACGEMERYASVFIRKLD